MAGIRSFENPPDAAAQLAPRELAAPAAGLAALDPATMHERWAEEARHQDRFPGAFEWWHFESISPAGDGLQLTLFEGLPFHPNYVTQINRHSRRLAATPFDKIRADVQASHYPAAHFAAFQGGKRVAQFLNLYPPMSATGESGPLDIRIGPNRITLRQDGSFGIVAKGYPFDIRRGQPLSRHDQTLSAQLTFVPTFPGVAHSRAFRLPSPDGAQHHWSLAAPHGIMTGNVQLLDRQENVSALDLHIHAVGYHDHVYSQGSLAAGIRKMLWGFIQGDTWTVAWHQALLRSGPNDHADGLILFEKAMAPVVVESPACRLEERRMSHWLLRHYARISMHGSTAQGHSVELLLHNHDLLNAAPFHSGLAATGTLTIPGQRSYTGNGTTNVLKLQRLQWPLLSDVTLRAITRVSQDDPLWRA